MKYLVALLLMLTCTSLQAQYTLADSVKGHWLVAQDLLITACEFGHMNYAEDVELSALRLDGKEMYIYRDGKQWGDRKYKIDEKNREVVLPIGSILGKSQRFKIIEISKKTLSLLSYENRLIKMIRKG